MSNLINLLGDPSQFDNFCRNFHWSFPWWVNYLKLIGFIILIWWSILLIALIFKIREDLPPEEKLEKWRKLLAKKQYSDKISYLWQDAEEKLSSDNNIDWQIALNEITKVFKEILGKMRLPGNGIESKIASLINFQFFQVDDLLAAYQFSIKLPFDSSLDKSEYEKIKQAVENYRLFFHWLELV